jgi:lysozyme
MTPLEKQLYDMEGEVLSAYQDHLGYWTIGVGHLIDKRKGGSIPVSISRQLLALDIKEKTQELSAALPWTASLDEARFGALVNMAFQMGVKGVLKFPKMLLHMRNGNWQAACDEALKIYTAKHGDEWPEQTPERAKRVARQILTGLWS